MVLMDEIDEKIIEMLKEDSRTPFLKIAQTLGISEGAVRSRVKKLVKSGVIKKFTIEVSEPENVKAIVLVKTSPEMDTAEVRENILRVCRNVTWCFEISGSYDIILLLSARNISEMNTEVEKIRKIKGVSETLTNFVMNE